jgi:hypothetical protein
VCVLCRACCAHKDLTCAVVCQAHGRSNSAAAAGARSAGLLADQDRWRRTPRLPIPPLLAYLPTGPYVVCLYPSSYTCWSWISIYLSIYIYIYLYLYLYIYVFYILSCVRRARAYVASNRCQCRYQFEPSRPGAAPAILCRRAETGTQTEPLSLAVKTFLFLIVLYFLFIYDY